MTRWMKNTWHDAQILQMDEERTLVCTAASSETADQMVAEHNALLEAVESMAEVLRISDRKHDAWDRAHAALNKLKGDNT